MHASDYFTVKAFTGSEQTADRRCANFLKDRITAMLVLLHSGGYGANESACTFSVISIKRGTASPVAKCWCCTTCWNHYRPDHRRAGWL
jgi:hypothetical protein